MKALALVAAVLVLGGCASGPAGLTLRADELTVTIDEPHPGSTDLALTLTGPAATSAFVQVQAVQPVLGHATPELVATAAGGGRYTVAGLILMTTGPWELRVRVTDREARTVAFEVTS